MSVAEKFHRASCSQQELAQTFERLNKQYDRALMRVSALQKELQEAHSEAA